MPRASLAAPHLWAGAGTIVGAILGSLIIASLANGMSVMIVAPFWQYIVRGSVLILAVSTWTSLPGRGGGKVSKPVPHGRNWHRQARPWVPRSARCVLARQPRQHVGLEDHDAPDDEGHREAVTHG